MARPFHETLHKINGGVLLHDAAESLAELVQAVTATGKPGKIILEITLRKSTSQTLAASGKVKLNRPKEPEIETLLFPTPDGHLLTEDPRQAKLPLQIVQAPTADQLLQAQAPAQIQSQP
ncbi:MAG: hypothetical protein DMF06_15025 [Verrucomicrobia bacterium]|nr:MAG: hypothetical protein DMF06_15025 [Verrucomicrobiota bacterium]